MSFNINKASLQRTYESFLKAARSNDYLYGIDVPDPSSVSKKAKAKRDLLAVIASAEARAYDEALLAGSRDARVTAYNTALDNELQQIAPQFGLTYKPAGTTLRA